MNIYRKSFDKLLSDRCIKARFYQRLKDDRKHPSVAVFFLRHDPLDWILEAFIQTSDSSDTFWSFVDNAWRFKVHQLNKRIW